MRLTDLILYALLGLAVYHALDHEAASNLMHQVGAQILELSKWAS